MSPDIQFSFPPSHPVLNEADVAGERGHSALAAISPVDPQGASAEYLPLRPTQNLNSPSQAMTDFTDGSDALFAMYNEMAAKRDQKLAENWREDANAIMLLSGLISATVAGFLSQSYLSSQTSSQDVSAFYLSQLYQLQAAGSNSSSTPPAPKPPNPASTPTMTNILWFASLVESLSTAVFATLIQEWVRRYQVMTQPLYSPHKNARIRAFITRKGSLFILQNTVDILHAILHQSIFFFLLGLITFTSSGDRFVLVAIIIFIVLPVVLYLKFSLTPYSDPHSLFSTPISGLLLSFRKIPSVVLPLFKAITRRRSGVEGIRHGTNVPTEVGWLTWVHAVNEIEKLSETCSSTLDSWAISTLIISLSRDQAMEQFLEGIPGFYRSTRVENPAEILRDSNTDRLPKAIVAFMDHSLSSGLFSDTTRRQRITLALKAIQADSYLLQRTFHHSLGFIESPLFTCVDFVLLADQHANDDDLDVRLLARCIIAVAINRLGDYRADERWEGIIQRGLNWSESSFVQYREHLDSVQLRNLIQLARELNITHPDINDPSTRTILGNTLCAARQVQVENADLRLQRDFCDLWNSFVASIHDRRQLPIVRSNAIFVLSHLRPIYATLHQSTDSGSLAFSATTDDLDPFLQKAHPLCTVPSHLSQI